MPSIKFLKENFIRFHHNCQRFMTGWHRYRAWLSFLYCALRHGASPDDYFRYQFYKKSDLERSRFITYRRSKQIIKKYNNKNDCQYLSNKIKFNQFFSDFIKRDWISLDEISDSDFHTFVSKYGRVILKPLGGGQGKGIEVINSRTARLLNLDNYKGYIAEELLKQNEKMQILNESSVNTLRILTFKGAVIACALRIGGKGSIVDNLHSKGVCAHINTERGIIDHVCIDNQLNEYTHHPDSNVNLLGFEIPLFYEAKELVCEAAKKIPSVQYIGWDVAILENKVALIEGNHDPGHDVVQMIAQTGLYEIIKTS